MMQSSFTGPVLSLVINSNLNKQQMNFQSETLFFLKKHQFPTKIYTFPKMGIII